MNKLDKQFEDMMKGVRIDSPSSDFTLKVMNRIQAEAAVTKLPVVQDYQPVISKKAWAVLISAFVLLLIYITVSGTESASTTGSGWWTRLSESINLIKTTEASSLWRKGMGILSSIPSIAYLILTVSLALWTLDGFLTRFRHQSSGVIS